jgi:hypothetical protein
MSAGGIAILTVCGGILVAMIGGWVELHKSRKSQGLVQHEVQPNSGGSLRDAVNRIETAVGRLDDKVDSHTERLVRVETLVHGRGSNV